MTASVQRHRRGFSCPVCGGFDEQERGDGKRCSGFTSGDGEFAHCSREELALGLPVEGGGTYAHWLKGDCKCGAQHEGYVPPIAPITQTRAKMAPIVAEYVYADEQGEPLFRVLRRANKTFFQQHWEPTTKTWERGLNGQRRVPYMLQRIMSAPPDATLVLVEGEKDCDRLTKLGVYATTNPNGAKAPGVNNWNSGVRDTMRAVVAGRHVVVIADADDAGRPFAAMVATDLHDVAASIRVLEPPAPHKDVSDLLDAGLKYADLIPMPGWPPPAAGAAGKPPKPPKPPPPPTSGRADPDGMTADHTDLRNAERLIEWYGDRIRHVSSWGRWLAWDGSRWSMDDGWQVFMHAKDVARRMLSDASKRRKAAAEKLGEAIASGDTDSIKRAERVLATATFDEKHAIRSQASGKISAMVEVAGRSDPAIILHHDALDSDRMLLNVANGTLDLRTGALRPHEQTDLLTKLAPVVYDADAKAPIWETFLLRVMGGNREIASFLQRFIGYTLTGEVSEHVLFFAYGNGANGKSTFLSTIHSMLGDYATPAARGLLFRSRGDQHDTRLATLHGKRFVTCSEVEEGVAFDESLMKDLTGGDPINARRMREDEWTFLPSHKMFMAGDHKPTVRGDDDGVWRRLRLVPFTVTIPEHERDPHLPEKLRAELPGILAWAVRGCLEWRRHGLQAPDEVKSATSQYREENDVLGQFFKERLVFEPTAVEARSVLRSTYETWCREMGTEPVGAKRLARRLAREPHRRVGSFARP